MRKHDPRSGRIAALPLVLGLATCAPGRLCSTAGPSAPGSACRSASRSPPPTVPPAPAPDLRAGNRCAVPAGRIPARGRFFVAAHLSSSPPTSLQVLHARGRPSRVDNPPPGRGFPQKPTRSGLHNVYYTQSNCQPGTWSRRRLAIGRLELPRDGAHTPARGISGLPNTGRRRLKRRRSGGQLERLRAGTHTPCPGPASHQTTQPVRSRGGGPAHTGFTHMTAHTTTTTHTGRRVCCADAALCLVL